MKFTDEQKQVKEFSQNWFGFGVHKVQIGLVENGGTEEGEKEYIEVTVMDPNDGEITDTARVWFTTDNAANYSFNTLRQIYVHNAPEDKKDEARDTFDKVADTDEITALMNEKLIGKECWFSKYPSPDRTYQAQDGSVKKSIDKNIYGYEPKEKPELLPKDGQKEELNKTFPGAEDAAGTDGAAGIPKGW